MLSRVLVLLACVLGLSSGRLWWNNEGVPTTILLKGERFDAGSLRVRQRLSEEFGARRDWNRGVEQPMILHVKGGTDARVLSRFKEELGLEVKYIPHNAILVHSSPERVELVRAAFPEVVWAAPLQPHHKVDPQLYSLMDDGGADLRQRRSDFSNETRSISTVLRGRGGGVELAVLMSKGRGGHEVAAEWQEFMRWKGFEGVSVRAASPKKVILATTQKGASRAADIITWVAQQPDALWVEKRPVFKLLNKWARGIIQSGNSLRTPLWDRGLQGQGQVLGIADTGISSNLCFFWDSNRDVPYNRVDTSHRKIISYKYDAGLGDDGDSEGHGTHTTGSLAADAPAGSPEADFNGMAPKAKIFFTDIYADGILSPPDDLENDLFPEPYLNGAKIRSESWGGDSIFYTSSAMEADSFAHQNRDFLVVWAAGNEGDLGLFTVGDPATGKNMLCVGAQNSASASMELQNSQTHFFEVTQGSNSQIIEAMWASNFGPRTAFEGQILEGFDETGSKKACYDLINPSALQGKIVLVQRGECFFSDKARKVQATGALAMLVADDQSYSSIVIMSGSGALDDITIPSMSISRQSSESIRSMLTQGPVSLRWTAAGADMWQENLASFSSRGPTGDGRTKPDVLTVGADIWSAKASRGENGHCNGVPPQQGASVVDMGGTSMAAPVAAGGVALIRQYFMQGWYPSGAANAADGFNPSSALLRAVVLNGARALQGQHGGFGQGDSRWEEIDSKLPNNHQGWGSMRLAASIILNPPIEGQPSKLLIKDESGPHAAQCLQTGDAYALAVDVQAGESLKVTLAWTDPPASLLSEVILINDLDLSVSGPDGVVRLGNEIESMDAEGGVAQTYDRLNNQESITINSPAAGVHKIIVRGHAVPEGPQCFALAISGAFTEQGQASVACEGGCGLHGGCIDGVCVCDQLWYGEQCDVAVELVAHTTTITSRVWAYGWQYYAIDLGPHTGGSFSIDFKRMGPVGDPDIYLIQGTDRLPSFKDFSWLCKCPDDSTNVCDCRELSCDSCDANSVNVMHHLQSSPLRATLNGTFILGVTGFCCEAAQYQLTITINKVGCDGVLNSGKEKDVCGVCGGTSACAGCDGVAYSGVTADACGVCGGNGMSCLGCDGVPNSGKVVDVCGDCGGMGRACVGCDGVKDSGKKWDACNVCEGDGSSCAGCDGVSNSGKAVDSCGVCGGNNASCAGCDGVPNSGKVRDVCSVCGGDGTSCLGCDGVVNSGLKLDRCGVCGGRGYTCVVNGEDAVLVVKFAVQPVTVDQMRGSKIDAFQKILATAFSLPLVNCTIVSVVDQQRRFRLGWSSSEVLPDLEARVEDNAVGGNTWEILRAGVAELWEGSGRRQEVSGTNVPSVVIGMRIRVGIAGGVKANDVMTQIGQVQTGSLDAAVSQRLGMDNLRVRLAEEPKLVPAWAPIESASGDAFVSIVSGGQIFGAFLAVYMALGAFVNFTLYNRKTRRVPKPRVALFLWATFGIVGAHRFYTRHTKVGVIMFLTLGLLGFGWLSDLYFHQHFLFRAGRRSKTVQNLKDLAKSNFGEIVKTNKSKRHKYKKGLNGQNFEYDNQADSNEMDDESESRPTQGEADTETMIETESMVGKLSPAEKTEMPAAISSPRTPAEQENIALRESRSEERERAVMAVV